MTIVCTPPLFLLGWGRGLSLLPNFQKERGLDRISNFKGGLFVKRAVTFFREERRREGRGEECSFYIKGKLIFKTFNDKRVYKQKCFFSVITKNLDWGILTKNLVTLKR